MVKVALDHQVHQATKEQLANVVLVAHLEVLVERVNLGEALQVKGADLVLEALVVRQVVQVILVLGVSQVKLLEMETLAHQDHVAHQEIPAVDC
jgi:hypothetical protein